MLFFIRYNHSGLSYLRTVELPFNNQDLPLLLKKESLVNAHHQCSLALCLAECIGQQCLFWSYDYVTGNNEKHLPSDLFHVTPEQVKYTNSRLFYIGNMSIINMLVKKNRDHWTVTLLTQITVLLSHLFQTSYRSFCSKNRLSTD